MDLDIYDYNTALDLSFTLTKAERLQVRSRVFSYFPPVLSVD